ncbi:hypothetical protein B7759_01082 [Burkholderia glumae]|nr:hypothetical protein B7759_01082 [Burkholderia glumae]
MTTERIATLATIETYLVGAPDAAVLQRKSVEFKHLAGLPLILPGRPNRLRNLLDDEARRAGIELRIVLEADSLAVQREVAATGRGYAVLGPWAIAPDVRSGRLRASRIVKPSITRFVTLASSSQGAMTPAIRIVIATLKEIASELSESGVYDGLASQRVEPHERIAPKPASATKQTSANRPVAAGRRK